ncbi:MAG: ATP synthase F1 subunit epsilon [Candidatus Chisholmbacteria bacterium RIFCSPLOWO2_01_FULL_50_28]|uniref:ATP synthase epsilon chain n=1 Tax=Candidatus Chisholmbacteria bacterium RIFCSPHIGHO2_01_FULL_52_32 TaxID=1797591 RepID=A0A1G1VSL7_9BACT|nr:MAG: ATP synthase F1 subunit epsilon [Candidatus Chisholmbacteria bacterium RIFCSPHIGHO2_01_FULL_52_32]OGY20240.1 MAG: ATP synthase F1 subunit epsilon [Candidatus Chisholmbacteria bacterium RIFCSPLOWO2_01_FULL_50_28]
MELFSLEVISQDTVLYQDTAESVTAYASEGAVTILAHHTPFFSSLNTGTITVRKGDQTIELVTGAGFIDVSSENTVTILVDSAVRAEEIDIRKAEEAKTRAEELLKQRVSRTEILLAEASLKKAVLELKVARARKHHGQTFS